MISIFNFAIMYDPIGNMLPNESIADLAVSCVQSSLISLFVLIASVLLGSNIFFFRKNKKVLVGIILGFLVLFGLLVSLGNFFSNTASAQRFDSGATLDPYYPRYSYSCPSTWETFVDSWPKYLIQIVILSVVVFFILFIISLVIRHFRKNKTPAKIENAFPEEIVDNSAPQQPSEENTTDNSPENPDIDDNPNPPENSDITDSKPTNKNTI